MTSPPLQMRKVRHKKGKSFAQVSQLRRWGTRIQTSEVWSLRLYPPHWCSIINKGSFMVSGAPHTHKEVGETFPYMVITSNLPKFSSIKIAQGPGQHLLPSSAPREEV